MSRCSDHVIRAVPQGLIALYLDHQGDLVRGTIAPGLGRFARPVMAFPRRRQPSLHTTTYHDMKARGPRVSPPLGPRGALVPIVWHRLLRLPPFLRRPI